MLNKSFSIDGREIGAGHSPYVIAELSGNHNLELGRALALIEAAHAAGADAVKLQTYTADSLTLDTDDPDFVIQGGLWDGERLYDLYQRAGTPYEWFPVLFGKARGLGITIFSSPFDLAAVDMLEELDAPAYKIASPEIEDWPLIERVAKTGRPMIVSTGAAEQQTIQETYEFIKEIGVSDVAFLHCISAYPAPLDDSNLRTMVDLSARYPMPVGLSDHTLGTTAAVTAAALGAAVIEKHVTLSRDDGGVDSAFSLEPQELQVMVREVRDAHASLGSVIYGTRESESTAPRFRRVFYTSRDIRAGETLGPDNLRSVRGLRGVSTCKYREIFGRRANRDISEFSPLDIESVEDAP
jgi:N-acetylneuraminate synthase